MFNFNKRKVKIMKRQSGFTLAEVLITLGIIGVVAAMTIPSLINQTNGQQYKTGFKKIVSVLSQAVTMSVALNDMDFSTMSSAGYTDTASIAGMFSNRLSILSTTNTNGTHFEGGATAYTVQLSDGMLVSIAVGSSNCTSALKCTAYVDVNGTKLPNKLSTATNDTSKSGLKDEFIVLFYDQQVSPADAAAQYALFN
jgi:prepilin-type N-terminal cleavage/methylation domain-containing protein